MSPKTTKTLGQNCNNLFLKLLYSLPQSGTVTNPINLDLSPDTTTEPRLRDPSTMASEGKSASWSDSEEKLLFLQILSEQNIKVDYAAVAAKVNRSASAVKQHLNKMKNDAKKASSNFATPDNAAAANSGADNPKPPKRRATPKQKAATSMANGNDFAAGYGSSGETRTEEPSPIKPSPAKKSRAPPKPKDGEPATKKQKTASVADKDVGSMANVKVTSPVVFSEQLLAAASPGSIKMEGGSDGEATTEKKRTHGMMGGSNLEEEDGDDEDGEGGNQGGQFEEAMLVND